jgi:hypothetical protein
LARAVALEERAKRLAGSASGAQLTAEISAIELDASNIRMLLTDTLRGAYGGPPPLEEVRRRLEDRADQLDELENRLGPEPPPSR